MVEIAGGRRHLLLAALAAGAVSVEVGTAQAAQPGATLKVIAEINAKAEYADQIRGALTSFSNSTRNEPGCLHYDLYEDAKQLGRFFTYEIWTGEAALKAHLTSPAMTAASAKLGAMLKVPPEVNMLIPLNVA